MSVPVPHATGSTSPGSQRNINGSRTAQIQVDYAWDGENPLEALERRSEMARLVSAALERAGLGIEDDNAIGTRRCKTVFAVTDPDAAIALITETLDHSVFADYQRIAVTDATL